MPVVDHPDGMTEPVRSVDERVIFLTARSAAIALLIPIILWRVAGYRHTDAVGVWLVSFGFCVAISHFALQQAKNHLVQGWHEEGALGEWYRRWVRTWSLNPSAYEPTGRRWFWLSAAAFLAAGLLWLVGNERLG